MAVITAPQPPRGWNTPNSYSMNDRMVNRLGHLNGDMPRYLAWNENARRTRSSLKYVARSLSTVRCGRISFSERSTSGRSRSRGR